jgi:hypothetical protein
MTATHKCAAPRCGRYIGWRFLMCPKHWSLVPREIQMAVYRAWNDGKPTPAYTAARERAIASLVQQRDFFEPSSTQP